MTSKERLYAAMDGKEPDRIPRAMNFYRVNVEGMAPPGAFRDDMLDVRFVRFTPSPEEEELKKRALPYSGDTRLGSASQVATYQHWNYCPDDVASRNPLAGAESLDDLKQFPFPEVRGPYLDEDLSRQVADIHGRELAAAGGLPHLGGELFEAAWRLRGLDNFLIDLIRRPDWAHYILDRLVELAVRNAESLARAGIDVLALDDDVGMPGSMMISPATWREFFKPRMAAIIHAARHINPEIRVLYHSDGAFDPIIGELAEIGVNAINPIQPEHMDAERIRREHGTRPALWGTVGRQTTFSFASPDEIRTEVKHRVDTLGRAGLILCPAYDINEPDIPWESGAAFLEAADHYGRPQ